MIDWNRIESFVGYGHLQAPVVFIGMEEGAAADDAKLPAELVERSSWEQVCPITEIDSIVRTWRPMCDLMLRRNGVARPTLKDRRDYQKYRLGRPGEDSLLMELLPYPARRSDRWPYGGAPYNRDKNRKEYKSRLIPKRQEMLKKIIEGAPRELIVGYGKEYWEHYEKLLEGVTWDRQPEPPYKTGYWKAARVVFAPHFVHKHFNKDDQLENFHRVCQLPADRSNI
jgi:hypothetical protein